MATGEVSTSTHVHDEQDPAIDPQTQLTFRYMKTQGPWTVYNFPDEYLPLSRRGYRSPRFLFGIGITLEDFTRYAQRRFFYHSDEDFAWPFRTLLHLGKTCGVAVGFLKVYGSQFPYILSLCSNYTARMKYPIDEAIKLAKELELMGIEAKVRWFMKYLTQEEENRVQNRNWSGEYHQAVHFRRRSVTSPSVFQILK